MTRDGGAAGATHLEHFAAEAAGIREAVRVLLGPFAVAVERVGVAEVTLTMLLHVLLRLEPTLTHCGREGQSQSTRTTPPATVNTLRQRGAESEHSPDTASNLQHTERR